MNRILKGFDYFYKRKPSQWTLKDTFWLHKWMKMVKPHLPKDEDEGVTEEFVKKLFNPNG